MGHAHAAFAARNEEEYIMFKTCLLAVGLALATHGALAQSDTRGAGVDATDNGGAVTPGTTNCARASDPDCRTGPAGGSMGSGGGMGTPGAIGPDDGADIDNTDRMPVERRDGVLRGSGAIDGGGGAGAGAGGVGGGSR
ncbi:MAG: hypothetical protein AB7P42_09310 [Gammaproteobacteria bacterium]